MQISRLLKIFTVPYKLLYAQLYPVEYARRLGVTMKGSVTIYGSSYKMFSSEPYLVTLGDNVYISLDARFICHDGSVLPFRKDIPDIDITKRIVVGDNVFIGLGAFILAGVTIGNNCVIGANSVVTKDVPDGSIYGGNPARFIKSTSEYLEKAQKDSLHIGHITGKEKVKKYKSIFGIK
ncbi:MAG: acyltransferase [Sulfurospirillaceae bacterium]|nr:acyltransferase [Sulfurospirillaceae bacterium]